MIYINQPINLIDVGDDVLYDVKDEHATNYINFYRLDDIVVDVTYDNMTQPNLTITSVSPFDDSYVVVGRYHVAMASLTDDDAYSIIGNIYEGLNSRWFSRVDDIYVNLPATFISDMLTLLRRHDPSDIERALTHFYLRLAFKMSDSLSIPEQRALNQTLAMADTAINPSFWLALQRTQNVQPQVLRSELVRNELSALRPLSQNVFMKQIAFTAQQWVVDEWADYRIDTNDSDVPSMKSGKRLPETLATERLGSQNNQVVSVLIDPAITTVATVIEQLKAVVPNDFHVMAFDYGHYIEIQAKAVDFTNRTAVMLLPYNYVFYAMQSADNARTSLMSIHNEYQKRKVRLVVPRSYDTFHDYKPSDYDRRLVPVWITNNRRVNSVDPTTELRDIINAIH